MKKYRVGEVYELEENSSSFHRLGESVGMFNKGTRFRVDEKAGIPGKEVIWVTILNYKPVSGVNFKTHHMLAFYPKRWDKVKPIYTT